MTHTYNGTRRQHPRTKRPLKPCSTDAAYRRHLKERTIPCDDCTRAHALVVRNWWQQRKEKAS